MNIPYTALIYWFLQSIWNVSTARYNWICKYNSRFSTYFLKVNFFQMLLTDRHSPKYFPVSLNNPTFEQYVTFGVTDKPLLWNRLLLEKLRSLVSKKTYRIYGPTKQFSRSQHRLSLSHKSSLDPPILFLKFISILSSQPRLNFPRYVQTSIYF